MDQQEWERSPLRLNLIEDSVKRAQAGVSKIIYLPQTGSTNQVAVDLLAEGNSEFAVVTDFQSAGKGRLNRIWEASPESSLLISLAFKLNAITNLGWLNLWAATIARRVLMENFNFDITLKWPNDLVVATPDAFLKFGGILSEIHKEHVIFGIGINYSQDHSELPTSISTSIKLQNANFVAREFVIADLISNFHKFWNLDTNCNQFPAKAIMREYQAASYTLGRRVVVTLPSGKEISGIAVALAENGALMVRNEKGEIETITAGDVN